MIYVFFISLFLILWHNLFYWVTLILLFTVRKLNYDIYIDRINLPYVSLIIAVHNEEKVIEKKVINALSLDYPNEKFEIIFASDNSTDKTNEIISDYAKKYNNIKLFNVEKRGGKVNAYNEAMKITKGKILAFSDANTFWEKDSLLKLIGSLQNEDVSCACGRLIYTNTDESKIAYSEGLYWKLENTLKEAESSFYSLTALNGGIYAIKRADYIFIDPLYSHDLCFPLLLATKKKRTIFVKNAIAFERSSTTSTDEVKRKTRMFGRIYSFIFKNPSLFLYPFKYSFKFFISIFSHRTIRYLLPFLHFLLLVSSILLSSNGIFFKTIFYLQVLFLVLAVFSILTKHKFKLFFLFYYYLLFLITMVIGFINFVTKRIKPYWESAETTRL